MLENLYKKIEEMLSNGEQVNIAIDGGCCAGKSTFAKNLKVCGNVFHMDDYFLPMVKKTTERMCQPGGNVDYERVRNEVFSGIESGTEFFVKKFNCKTQSFEKPRIVVPEAVNIIEGVYSMHPYLENFYNIKVFIDIDWETRRKRLYNRESEEMYKRFIDEWIPMENRYFTEYNIKERCDFIIGDEK